MMTNNVKICVNNNNNNNGETLILDIGDHASMHGLHGADDGWQYSGYWGSPAGLADHNGGEELLHYGGFEQMTSPGSDTLSSARWIDSPYPRPARSPAVGLDPRPPAPSPRPRDAGPVARAAAPEASPRGRRGAPSPPPRQGRRRRPRRRPEAPPGRQRPGTTSNERTQHGVRPTTGVIPSLGADHRLSKFETLQMAQTYIAALCDLLGLARAPLGPVGAGRTSAGGRPPPSPALSC